MQYPDERTLQGALRSAALAVWWHSLHPDTNSSQGEEKKIKLLWITGWDYTTGGESRSAARELCLILLVSLPCWSPCCLWGWLQTESTFGSLSQASNSASYLNSKHTARVSLHSMAQEFCSLHYFKRRNCNQNLLPTYLAQIWMFSPFSCFLFFLILYVCNLTDKFSERERERETKQFPHR